MSIRPEQARDAVTGEHAPSEEHLAAYPSSDGHPDEVVLTAKALPLRVLLLNIWRSRTLLFTLGRQDFFVRYRRASFGVLWAVGLPLVQALVLAFVFGHVVRLTPQPHFLVFVLSGITAWSFFSNTLGSASTAIVDGSGMANKIYFPRAVLPLIKVISSVYGSSISVVLLVVVALVTGVPLGPQILYLVPGSLLLILLTVGFSVSLSALHVYFRDVRFLVMAALTVWFYATPIFYSVSYTSGLSRTVLQLNPMTGVVELFRAATVGADPDWWVSVTYASIWCVVLLLAAVELHRRFDRVFSDLL